MMMMMTCADALGCSGGGLLFATAAAAAAVAVCGRLTYE